MRAWAKLLLTRTRLRVIRARLGQTAPSAHAGGFLFVTPRGQQSLWIFARITKTYDDLTRCVQIAKVIKSDPFWSRLGTLLSELSLRYGPRTRSKCWNIFIKNHHFGTPRGQQSCWISARVANTSDNLTRGATANGRQRETDGRQRETANGRQRKSQ